MTAWVTLSATTRNMERDIKDGVRRVERGAKFEVKPKLDASGLSGQASKAGRDFSSRFSSSAGSGFSAGGGAVGSMFMGAFAGVASVAAFTALASAGAHAYVGTFQSILDTGLDFSRTMNNFQGVTRASADEMRNMKDAARALGADTTLAGVSASDAAKAMTELAKAGFSVDQAIGAARGTMQLATAGQIEAAQAAEIQANAMNAFGLGAESAAHTADLLANAAIASSADIPDLGLALQQVGGIAHGFGENLDDTVAALALFANAGIKGSDAGTLLKTTMQSITDQGNPAQGAIEALGLELYKLNASGDKVFVGFRELFRQLGEAKKRMTSEDFQAFSNILFGSDAMRAAMLGNADAFDVMLTKMQRTGAASEMAAAQMQGLPGAVEGFKNTAESLKLTAFEQLGPTVTNALNQITGAVQSHGPEIIKFFMSITDAALAFGEVVLHATGTAAGAIGEFIAPLGDVLGAMAKFQALQADIRGDKETAAELRKQADSFFGMGEGLKSLSDKAGRVDLSKFRDELRTAGDAAATSAGKIAALDAAAAKTGSYGWFGPPKPAASSSSSSSSTPWDAVAKAESSGNWKDNNSGGHSTSSGAPRGGLQITDGTWRAFGGEEFAPTANLATREQQITVAERIAFSGYKGTKPQGLGAWEAVTKGMVPGVTTDTASESFLTASSAAISDFGASKAAPTVPPPDEKSLRAWVEQNFGIKSTFGTGSWENAAHDYDKGWHHMGQNLVPGGVKSGYGFDFSGTQEQMDKLANWIANNMVGQTLELIYQSPGFDPKNLIKNAQRGTNAYGADLLAQHAGHVHWATTAAPGAGGPPRSGMDTALTGGGYREAPTAREVREAGERLADRENALAIQEQQLRELKSDAKQSEVMQALADVDKARRERDDAKADLEETKRGKYKEAKESRDTLRDLQDSTTGGADTKASSFGESLVSGMLQGIGLDGSVFSNPLEWPNVKSAFALANWGGGMLRGLSGGAQGPESTLGGVGGAFPDVMLPNIADFASSPGGGPIPAGMPEAHGVAAGAAPGPSFVINGDVGMDPRAVTERFDAAHNQAWRRNMAAVRP